MSTEYIPEWAPLLDGIMHIQRIQSLGPTDAASALRTRLYDGKIKSRVAGRRYEIPRHDGIAQSVWYYATIFRDGSVEFGRDSAVPPPAGLGLPRRRVEVYWADVLRNWPDPPKREDVDDRRPHPTEDQRKNMFKTWMEAQKERWGNYPARDRPKSHFDDPNYPTIMEWPAKGNETRELLLRWAKDLGLKRRIGAPNRNSPGN